MTANPDGVRLLALADKIEAFAHGLYSASEAGLLLEAVKALRAAPVPQRDAEPVIFTEEDWPERDKELAAWFNSLPGASDASWDALMEILSAAPPSRLDAGSAGVIDAAKALMAEVERTADSFDWLAPIADLRLALNTPLVLPAGEEVRRLSDYTDAEIATEHGWRMQRALGDQSVCVGTALSPSSNGKPATENNDER